VKPFTPRVPFFIFSPVPPLASFLDPRRTCPNDLKDLFCELAIPVTCPGVFFLNRFTFTLCCRGTTSSTANDPLSLALRVLGVTRSCLTATRFPSSWHVELYDLLPFPLQSNRRSVTPRPGPFPPPDQDTGSNYADGHDPTSKAPDFQFPFRAFAERSRRRPPFGHEKDPKDNLAPSWPDLFFSSFFVGDISLLLALSAVSLSRPRAEFD